MAGPVVVGDEAARLVLSVLRADDESGDLLLRATIDGLPDAFADLAPDEPAGLGDPSTRSRSRGPTARSPSCLSSRSLASPAA